jgi:Na+-transporting NADH:ubiquinone oxidoreductase subunit NqrD
LGFSLFKLFTLIKYHGLHVSISTVTLILAATTALTTIIIDLVIVVQFQVQPFVIFVWSLIWLFVPDTIQIMTSLTISFYW